MYKFCNCSSLFNQFHSFKFLCLLKVLLKVFKMSQLPKQIKVAMLSLLPSYIINEVTCFVFYDHHPRDKKVIDITVCTVLGCIKEFHKREVVRSIIINDTPAVWKQLRIIRNLKCEQFYLVSNKNSVVILSVKESLQVFKSFYNIDSFLVNAHPFSGAPILTVYTNGNTTKIEFCNSFKGHEYDFKSEQSLEDYPVINNLKRVLAELRYNIKCNEKCYEDFVKLRQIAAFCALQEMRPNIENTVFTDENKRVTTAILIETLTPWTKIWHQKVIIVVNITNKNDIPIHELQLLLHNNSSIQESLVYRTKLFQSTSGFPYWVEMSNHSLQPNIETSLVVVLDCKELEYNVSNIEFKGVLFYKKSEEQCFHPLNKVVLTANEIMEGNHDMFFNHQYDDPKIQLAILASSERTDLLLRHIKMNTESDLVMQDLFCQYLHMDKIPGINAGLMYKNKPLHKLHGVMVVFEETEDSGGRYSISVFARSPSQVVTLIHCINEFIPHRIVATLHTQKLTSRTEQWAQYNEDKTPQTMDENYKDYATSILNQTTMIIEYLDQCMIKMRSKKETEENVIRKIDLFVGGNESFLQFKEKIMNEAAKGFRNFVKREADN